MDVPRTLTILLLGAIHSTHEDLNLILLSTNCVWCNVHTLIIMHLILITVHIPNSNSIYLSIFLIGVRLWCTPLHPCPHCGKRDAGGQPLAFARCCQPAERHLSRLWSQLYLRASGGMQGQGRQHESAGGWDVWEEGLPPIEWSPGETNQSGEEAALTCYEVFHRGWK